MSCNYLRSPVQHVTRLRTEATFRHVRVHHRTVHVGLTEEFLHSASMVVVLEQVRREQMGTSVALCALRHARSANGLMYGTLEGGRQFLTPAGKAAVRTTRRSVPLSPAACPG